MLVRSLSLARSILKRTGLLPVVKRILYRPTDAGAYRLHTFGAQGAEIALVIALAYVIQIQTSAWCNRFVDRCFGQVELMEMPVVAHDRA